MTHRTYHAYTSRMGHDRDILCTRIWYTYGSPTVDTSVFCFTAPYCMGEDTIIFSIDYV